MKKITTFFLILIVGLTVGFFLFQTKKQPVEKKGGEKEEVKIKMEKEKILMVLAPENFRDEEYQKPRKVLEEAGFAVEVASKGVDEAMGMLGAKAHVDKDITLVNVDDYRAIVFVGGSGAAVYLEDSLALNLAKTAFTKEKMVGAICIAPSILANAGILEGKNATSFPSEEANLKAKGANYTGEPVTVDGKIVTARGPEAAQEFGEKIVEMLKRNM